jgi:hypothetical protein
MRCPTCGRENSGPGDCPACGTGWSGMPRPQPSPDIQLVRVFATGDAGLTAIARSLLDSEGIDVLVRGDALQDLFGAGRIAAVNPIVGPVEFWVREDDAARAAALLSGLDEARAGG